MNTRKSNKNRINIVLIFCVLVNILGEIANIALWYSSPAGMYGPTGAQGSLRGGYIASVTGGDNALIAGSVILAVVAFIYIVAMLGLLKRQKWGPLLVIAISVVNRAIALFLYEYSAAFYVWFVWTIILVVVAFLDYPRFTANTQSGHLQLARPETQFGRR